ncbi:MAG TPA: hypothetical protein VG369_01520 [Humibacter sp.]|nr:hypothetical protein [Humibacter sp.]
MDTSGESLLSIVSDLVVLALFVNTGIRMLPATRPFPWLALVVTVIVGVPSLLQPVFPQLTDALARDSHATLAQGQWWRILTALLAQDGGEVAAIFNLVVVALVLVFGSWIWGQRLGGQWLALALFLAPSIALNLLAVAWGQTGGGSSFASDGLIFSVFALALLIGTRDAAWPSRVGTIVVRVCGAVASVIGIVLVIAGDAHGVAMLLGLVLGLIAWAVARRSSPTRF